VPRFRSGRLATAGPSCRSSAERPGVSVRAHDNLIGIVIGYVVSVVALSGLMLTLVVKFGYGW
jgi:hypothetical protein